MERTEPTGDAAAVSRRRLAIGCCRCRCRDVWLALAIGVAACGGAVYALPATSAVRVWPRQFAASRTFNVLVQPSDTRRKAREYFEAQLPLIEASAREFECLDYWCANLTVGRWVEADWYGLIWKRYKSMYAKLQADARADDFKVEKDKCELYRWFERNGFRAMRVYHRWSAAGLWGTTPTTDADAVVRDLLSNATRSEYPMFLKICHITQGWQHATRSVPSYAQLAAQREEVGAWVSQLWAARANDWERPWVIEHNALTDTLAAGVMSQARFAGHFVGSFDGPTAAESEAAGAMVELKVYVIWGRAYMASSSEILLLRDGSLEAYTGWRVVRHGHTPSPWLHWVVAEGHLELAWRLAESAALVLGSTRDRGLNTRIPCNAACAHGAAPCATRSHHARPSIVAHMPARRQALGPQNRTPALAPQLPSSRALLSLARAHASPAIPSRTQCTACDAAPPAALRAAQSTWCAWISSFARAHQRPSSSTRILCRPPAAPCTATTLITWPRRGRAVTPPAGTRRGARPVASVPTSSAASAPRTRTSIGCKRCSLSGAMTFEEPWWASQENGRWARARCRWRECASRGP